VDEPPGSHVVARAVATAEQEEEAMTGTMKKSFEAPDEQRTPDKTEMAIVDLGSVKAARVTFQPGWKWSECIKPIVGTESC
jgi:hypothetical protein